MGVPRRKMGRRSELGARQGRRFQPWGSIKPLSSAAGPLGDRRYPLLHKGIQLWTVRLQLQLVLKKRGRLGGKQAHRAESGAKGLQTAEQ